MFGNKLRHLLRFASQQPEVREGSVFRHTGPGNLIETAKVVEVRADGMGIPHVVYDVTVEKTRPGICLAGLTAHRTLNLQSFAAHYSEAIEA